MCIDVFLSTIGHTVREILSRLGHWIQVLLALNPVDTLHNCMFENNLSLQNVFAKNYFAMFRKALEVGNIICIFL